MRAALLALGLLGTPRVGVAQNLVAQAVGREAEEYVDGALANLLFRTPLVAPAYRRPVVRAAVFVGASTVYETLLDPTRGQTGHQAWADWGTRAIGYALLEGLIAGWRALHR